ncbi:MAG: hypothetical protein J6M02_07040 [Clostridia bacterium]|nr:hypothetical protein [Clostridia bacterium]
MRSDEKGITMVELIIVMAMFFVVLPLIWNYINGAIEDSANVSNKMVVQTTVNQLMNNMQQNVQEASMPVTYSSADLEGKENESGGSIEIRKPGGITATYTYDPDTATVKYEMEDAEDNLLDSAEYGNIAEFIVKRMSSNVDSESGEDLMKVNGLKITITGRIDKKSNYSLSNEYYTRNTI